MLDYPALAALRAVLREGSFERAAAVLGVTPSAISQRVRGLEERIGAILIIRGQPCTPTVLGSRLCAHADRVHLLEADLAPLLPEAAAGHAPTLRIAVNADSLATWFPDAVAGFSRDSRTLLDLVLDDESHTAARLRAGEVLAAVTADPEPAQGCRTIPLGAMRYAACASPAFLARYFPGGITAAALPSAPHLRFDRRDMLQARWAKAAHGASLASPAHFVPSPHAFLDLALAGLGWGLHPLALAAPHLAACRLVELPPAQRLDVALYWSVARLHAAPLRRLTRDIAAAARRHLA